MLSQTHYHFIGISGIGMSGLAKILRQQGHTVSGCDSNIDSKHTQELIQLGCTISPIHRSSICNDSSVKIIVYTAALAKNHPELLTAQQSGLTILSRAELLAQLMKQKDSIAIAGSHGKTSTTGIVGQILHEAQLDPTIVVGGHMNALNSNAYTGKGKYLVAEADESDRSLLKLPKKFNILTNVDLEHLETYKDLDDVKQTFITFLNSTPNNGHSFICLDDQGVQDILPQITTSFSTYGTNHNADIQAHNISLHSDESTFDIYQKSSNSYLGSISTSEPGLHYVLNMTGAIALALHLGISFTRIQQALQNFKGMDRRFTFKGICKANNVSIFDDYGHHPKEIECALKVARQKTNNKLIVAFQPHRFSRTKHLWNDFIQTFANNNIDTLIITDIYPASEQPIEGITSQHLVQEIKKTNPQINIIYCPIDAELASFQGALSQALEKNSLLLLLGAGKIHKITSKLLA